MVRTSTTCLKTYDNLDNFVGWQSPGRRGKHSVTQSQFPWLFEGFASLLGYFAIPERFSYSWTECVGCDAIESAFYFVAIWYKNDDVTMGAVVLTGPQDCRSVGRNQADVTEYAGLHPFFLP
jgi:hypothetical protein